MGDMPDPTPDPTPDPDPDPTPDKPDHEAEAAKWKALARKHEGNAKANADAAKRLKELEDAGKTEVERANAAAADAEKRLAEAELRALRAEVASEKGLSAAQAKRLVGTTRDELEADADELLESFKPSGTEGDGGNNGKPKEALKPGASSADSDKEPDAKALLGHMPHGR